jgi:hypothetical protein
MKSQSIIFSIASTFSIIITNPSTFTNSFSPSIRNNQIHLITSSQFSSQLSSTSTNVEDSKTTTTTTTTSFIDTELRNAAMKLHTKSQAPKEGQASEKPKPTSSEPYITTHLDYLKFLIDSQYVYQTFESIVQKEELHPELTPFCNTKLERGDVLEIDIEFMVKEYGLDRPDVGKMGLDYGELLNKIVEEKGKEGIPELMCHWYNYYFAHTAGGRMIGKQMAALLLEKKTLEFYKVCVIVGLLLRCIVLLYYYFVIILSFLKHLIFHYFSFSFMNYSGMVILMKLRLRSRIVLKK